MSHTPCVLWPEAIQTSGFFYGWLFPLICVAGVLDFESREEADLALQKSARLDHLARVKDICGCSPVVIGRCSFDYPKSRALSFSQPELLFFDQQLLSYTIVSYRRPNLGKLEIYTLNGDLPPPDQPIPSPSRCPSAAHVAHDFTRAVRRSFGALEPKTIHQMNYGQLYEQAITNHPLKALLPLRGGVGQLGSFFARLNPRLGQLPPTSYVYTILYTLYDGLRQSSAIVHQVDIRFRQVISLTRTFPARTYDDGIVSIQSTLEYVAFYNCVWLILNDVIIGWAIGSFIRENASPIASIFDHWLRRLLIDDLQETLLWLNRWPAGLKLNTELSQFLCHSLLGAVVAWNRLLNAFILPHLPRIVSISGGLGYCGATVTVAIISDLLAFLTAHAYICYLILCSIYNRQLAGARSLWNLFRGKRYNVLRKRIDSWDYEVDQLLFGTILFTLMTFLFPTTFAYYALFATIRLAVLLCYAIFDILLILINEFPLFALLLRAKDPFRLPGGIAYANNETTRKGQLQNKTISLSDIFAHYGAFWSAFSAHYHPAILLWKFACSTRLTHIMSG